MKFCKLFAMAALLPLGVTGAELAAPATEVQIFRNGTALIRHQVDAGNASTFTVSGNFSPLEGTVWGSPNVKEIRKTVTEVTRTESIPISDITATFKNQFVTLYLNNGEGKPEIVKGTVLDLFKKKGNAVEEDNGHLYSQFVTLKCTKDKKIRIISIPRSQIVRVESEALKIAERTVKEDKQAWAFTLLPGSKGKVSFDYAARVLNWTPAFKMTLLPEKKFAISGSATVVNTGDELQNVKCILWAGSPNIENSNTFSPMAIVKKAIPRPEPRPMVYAMRKNRAPMAMAPEMAMADGAYSAEDAAEPGIVGNMVPFDTGALSLKKGEALVRTLGSAKGSYENLVRWRIPARQGDDGRNVWKNADNYTDLLWECLRFVNPFKHPIPDSAVEICDGGALVAQIKGTWVNAGETATWEITRCRDVKATFVEQEAPSSLKDRGMGLFQRIERGAGKAIPRSVLKKEPGNSSDPTPVKGGFYNGIWYRVTDIKGSIQLKNFRKTPVKMTVEMDYFGEFVSASANPRKKPLNHFGSLNPKNQLVWDITLKPGETRKLDFRYNIIINR